jgi:hypothetical protein
MREKIGKRELMDLQGLFWIEKVKIENTDRQCKRSNNLKKLNRSDIQQRHKKVSEEQEDRMMRQLREIPT